MPDLRGDEPPTAAFLSGYCFFGMPTWALRCPSCLQGFLLPTIEFWLHDAVSGEHAGMSRGPRSSSPGLKSPSTQRSPSEALFEQSQRRLIASPPARSLAAAAPPKMAQEGALIS
jgi:hypothetical protein